MNVGDTISYVVIIPAPGLSGVGSIQLPLFTLRLFISDLAAMSARDLLDDTAILDDEEDDESFDEETGEVRRKTNGSARHFDDSSEEDEDDDEEEAAKVSTHCL